MPQVRDHLDAVEPGVLGQRRWDDLEGVGEGAPADGLSAREPARLLAQLGRHLDLGGAAARDQGLLLDEAADHAERVVQGALRLVEDHGVGAAAHHRHGLAGRLGARDFHHAGAARLGLLDEVGGAELVFGEGVDVGDGLAARRLADELDLVALDVLDGQDVELG